MSPQLVQLVVDDSDIVRACLHHPSRWTKIPESSALLWGIAVPQRGSKGRTLAQKLFVGGLSFSTSTERLRETFAQAGQVESAAVVTDRETGQSRGFGFVEMSTTEEADQAIAKFNGKELDGRQLRVEKAAPGGSRSGGPGGSRGGFGRSSGRGRW